MNENALGDFIRERRTALQLTTREVAARCNVTHQAISRFEHGTAVPSSRTTYLLAQVLGVSGDELLRRVPVAV